MKPTRIFTLGGVREIGKACIVVEYDDEIVLIDAGIKFTNTMETGVEGIIPDYSYLKKNEHKIKGLFLTHAHEDHMGGIPYLIQQVKIPTIYSPDIGIAYLKRKIKDRGIKVPVKFEEMTADLKVKFKYLEVDFCTMQHSVPNPFAVRVKTPNGNVMDSCDFRFDYTPPITSHTDFDKLKEMGDEGLDVLFSESTNSLRPGHSPSEQTILNNIENHIVKAKGKVIFTTFASNINRLKMVMKMAKKHKRKIIPFGRSMVQTIEISQKIGFIDQEEANLIIDKKELSKYPSNEIIILSTGSQGEELAALSRISTGKHPYVKIKKGDVVIFSCSPIPGNLMSVEKLINNLYKVGAEIKENNVDGVLHISGHAYYEEQSKLIKLLKPKYFIPFHGSYRQAAAHGQNAIDQQINKDNIFIVENGEVLELINHKIWRTQLKIDTGPIYIDGNNLTVNTKEAIQKRERLAKNGFVNIIVTIDKKKNEIFGRTKIISRGTLFVKKSQEILQEAQRIAHGAILYTIKNNNQWKNSDIKQILKKKLETFFFRKKRRNPVIVTSILEKASR